MFPRIFNTINFFIFKIKYENELLEKDGINILWNNFEFSRPSFFIHHCNQNTIDINNNKRKRRIIISL